MRFGFLKFLLLAFVLIFGGAFAWLAFTDVPVRQQEVIVQVPIGNAQ